jgi:hypothetical protein
MWFVIYLLAAVFVGWLGRNKEIGSVGFFLVALFVSPPIGLLILMIAHNRSQQKSP